MKMYNLVFGAGILLLAYGFESSPHVSASTGNAGDPVISAVNLSDTIITPPASIQSSFSTRYPKATNVKWYQYKSTTVPIEWDLTGWPTLTEKDFAVTYDLDSANYYAWYDASGNWVGSTYQMKNVAGLPAPISQMLSSKYAGYKLTNVHTENYKDIAAYQLELNKSGEKVKMVVDPNGNVLKQKTKKLDAEGNEIKEKTKIQDK